MASIFKTIFTANAMYLFLGLVIFIIFGFIVRKPLRKVFVKPGFLKSCVNVKPGFFMQLLIVLYYGMTIIPLIYHTNRFECGKVCRQILLIGVPRKTRLQTPEFFVEETGLYEYFSVVSTVLMIIAYVRIIKKESRALRQTTSAPYFKPGFKNNEQKKAFYSLQSLLSNKCHQCDVQAPFMWHSDHSGACRVYLDHTCPWVAQDVCADNLLEFITFVTVGSVQSLVVFIGALIRLVHQLKYLKKAVIGEGVKVGLQYIVPAAVLSGPSALYAVLLLSGVASLMIVMQFGFQAYKLFVSMPQSSWIPFQNALDAISKGNGYISYDSADIVTDEDGESYYQYRVIKKNQIGSELTFVDGVSSTEVNGQQITILDKESSTKALKQFPYYCKASQKLSWLFEQKKAAKEWLEEQKSQ